MTRSASSIRIGLAGLLFCAALVTGPSLTAAAEPSGKAAPSQKAAEAPRPVVKIVQGGESKTPPEDCLATLVGPGINQPDPYPGYGGFVGWVSPVRLRNGDWLVGFSAGYWHVSAPTPLRFSPKTIESYHKLGSNLLRPWAFGGKGAEGMKKEIPSSREPRG